jgi:hypothetical protein
MLCNRSRKLDARNNARVRKIFHPRAKPPLPFSAAPRPLREQGSRSSTSTTAHVTQPLPNQFNGDARSAVARGRDHSARRQSNSHSEAQRENAPRRVNISRGKG